MKGLRIIEVNNGWEVLIANDHLFQSSTGDTWVYNKIEDLIADLPKHLNVKSNDTAREIALAKLYNDNRENT